MRRVVVALVAASVGLLPAPATAAPALVTVFVELDQPAAAARYREHLAEGRAAARQAVLAARASAAAATDAVLGRVRGAERSGVLFRTTSVLPGFAVRADARTVAQLAAAPGVRAVHRITPVAPLAEPPVAHRPGPATAALAPHPTNASADQLGRALAAWQHGVLGRGVRIGILDTGIDYAHADFGGGAFPNAKVVGGVDLAGDAYDAATNPVPEPDDDPRDCAGHGTHVAGTAAGLGVTADGSTFRGDHRTLTPEALDALRIGPGAAPEAGLYAIKIFGCSGSTALTLAGLDRALDPDGDGDLADHLDVVNVSLGVPAAAVDDPVNAAVRELAANGVLVVAAAGNDGDVLDGTSAPAGAADALAVASVRDAGVLFDALEVPGEGTFPGQYSVAYPGYATLDATLPVVLPGGDPQGCGPYPAPVRGALVWLEWGPACGSRQRADVAAAAGAAGVLLASTEAEFGASTIAGDERVPAFRMTAATTAALRPRLGAGLRVRLAGALAGTREVHVPGIADTLAPYSSRGLHGTTPKPDVAAPGDTITSAKAGTGSGGIVESGTSMASPYAAGVAALVRSAHPDWSPAEAKAAIMGTAGADVTVDGRVAGPLRAGAGRIDAGAAVSTTLLAADAQRTGGVSVGFGVVDVPPGPPVELRRQVVVRNVGDAPVAVVAGYRGLTTTPGATVAVSPERATVPPAGTAVLDVTARIDPVALRHTGDPVPADRPFVPDVTGLLTVAPERGPALRVPVAVAPRPVAQLSAHRDGERVVLAGAGLDQGAGQAAYRSRAGVFTLVARSPQLPVCTGGATDGCVANATGTGGDLRFVGVAAAADGTLGVAVSTWAELPVVGRATRPSVEFDTDGDGVADVVTELVAQPGTGAPVARTTRPDGTVLDEQPVDDAADTDTWVLRLRRSLVGERPALRAVVHGEYGAPGSPDRVVDATPATSRIDLAALAPPAPALLVPAGPGTVLPAPTSASVLVVIDRNPAGERATVLDPP